MLTCIYTIKQYELYITYIYGSITQYKYKHVYDRPTIIRLHQPALQILLVSQLAAPGGSFLEELVSWNRIP